MAVQGIHHVQLSMPRGEEAQAIGFYEERLVEEGVAVVDDEPLPGFERFYASDPFGNRLEFLERRQP